MDGCINNFIDRTVNDKNILNLIYGTRDQYISKVPLQNLTDDARKQIKLLTFRYNFGENTPLLDNWFLIGSYGYKQQKYWGDLDLRENITMYGSKQNAIASFARVIKRIINNYLGKNDRWFIEFKCGINPLFTFTNPDNNFAYMTLSPYTVSEFINILDGLYTRKNLLLNDYKDIIQIIFAYNLPFNQKVTDRCAEEKILKILRKYYILRWNANEVFTGYKILPGNIKVTLEQAIDTHQAINIECIAIVDGVLLDVSNFYVLTYQEELKPEYMNQQYPIAKTDYTSKAISFNQDRFSNFFKHSILSLTDSINTLLNSCTEQDAFKAIKRMWSLGRAIIYFSDDPKFKQQASELLERIVPYVSSDVSNLNSIKNNIDAVAVLVDNDVDNFPLRQSITQIKNTKFRVGKVTLLDNDDILKIYNPLLDGMVMAIQNADKPKFLELSEEFITRIKTIINRDSLQYLNEVGLIPLPSYLRI